MDNQTNGGFIQFPLCLLASKDNFANLLNAAFNFGVVHFLNSLADKDESIPRFFKASKEQREELYKRAQNTIVFNGGTANGAGNGWKLANSLIDWKMNQAWVRVKTTYYFAARNGEISECAARVLFGILSVIGVRDYSKIGWPMLQARAAGVLKPVMRVDDKGRKVPVPPENAGPIYTRRQIDYACDHIINRGFLAGKTYRRGERYWSHRLKPEELEISILALKAKNKKNRLILNPVKEVGET